jgi:hypothetical protein
MRGAIPPPSISMKWCLIIQWIRLHTNKHTHIHKPTPVVTRSKERMVFDRSNIEIVGSNPARNRRYAFVWVQLSYVCTDPAMGRSPIQGALPKWLKGFIVSKVNSDSEQTEGPNTWNEQRLCVYVCVRVWKIRLSDVRRLPRRTETWPQPTLSYLLVFTN